MNPVRIRNYLFTLTLAMVSLISSPAHPREITDMTGRKVLVPEHITRVYASSPPATYLLYSIDPSLIVGLNSPVNETEKHFLSTAFRSLPVIGSSVGQGKNLNSEMLLKAKPDIVLVWAWQQPGINEKFEQIFRQLKIPTVYIRIDSLRDYPAAFTFMGELLNRRERAEKLRHYADDTLQSVDKGVRGLTLSQRTTVYYAEGPDGLATEPDGSFHAELIGIAGGVNVHRGGLKDHYGMEKISMEQVMLYNPSTIIVQEEDFMRSISQDPRWKGVKGVKERHVWHVPRVPFNWFDRPPSFMRFLGLRWLTNRLHPDRFRFDPVVDTAYFYRLFLGIEPSSQEIREILRGS